VVLEGVDDRWGSAVNEIDMEEGVGPAQEKRAEKRSKAGAATEAADVNTKNWYTRESDLWA
jgi:hypothetical protein